MKSSYDVIVCGAYFLDLVFSGFSRMPNPGEELYGTGFSLRPGGAFNTILALHRFGVKTGWASDFGTDYFSNFVLEKAREEGIEDSLFVHHKRPLRSVTAAVSLPKDRAFITYADPAPKIPAALKALLKTKTKMLFLPGLFYGTLFHLGERLVKPADTLVVMDGNSSNGTLRDNPAIARAIGKVDLFLPNDKEALRLTETDEVFKALASLTNLCPRVIIKQGEKGALASWEGEILSIPAVRIKEVDSTGAGDIFDAGVMAAWLKGKTAKEAVAWGVAAGSLAVSCGDEKRKAVTLKGVEKLVNTLVSRAS